MDNTNFFSNTNPDLISAKTFSDLNKMVIMDDEPTKETKTLINTSLTFYKKYIQPNIIPIIIIILFIIVMIYRYMTSKKNDDSKKKRKKTLKNKEDIINIENENNIQIQEQNNLNQQLQIQQIPTIQSIDNVIDSVINKNDDILDDDAIYEMMEEKEEDNTNQYQDNDYINFAGESTKIDLHDANKKIFS